MITLIEQDLDGKVYLFRGESNNDVQSNYSYKHKTRFTSRFYSYEIYDGIYLFGNVVVYELLPKARLWDYDDEVESFISEYHLEDYPVPELKEIYGIDTLSECSEYGGTVNFDYHDLYHSRQIVAIAYLEDNMSNQYDGIIWYEYMDNPEYSLMIWNNDVVRRLSSIEAKEVVEELEKRYPDSLYAKDPEWDSYKYNLADDDDLISDT